MGYIAPHVYERVVLVYPTHQPDGRDVRLCYALAADPAHPYWTLAPDEVRLMEAFLA